MTTEHKIDTNAIIAKVTDILNEIIISHISSFHENNSFKVRPNYGYAKFYLDRVDGSYDMSLQGLIHHIMYSESIYKDMLNKDQYTDLIEIVNNNPEAIYSPNFGDNEYEAIQDTLDSIYWDSITFVAKKLIKLNFNVAKSFSEYLE
jgi:hypothetical protein